MSLHSHDALEGEPERTPSDEHETIPIDVRAAGLADAGAYIALLEAVAAEGTWIGAELPLDRGRVTSAVEEAATSQDAQLFVASNADVMHGAIHLRAESGVVGLGMLVSPASRHQGVGRRLLHQGTAWARAIKAHKMTLEVWPHNQLAIALYLGAGFVIEGRLRRQHRRRSGQLWDSLAMGLPLDVDSPGSPHPDAEGLERAVVELG